MIPPRWYSSTLLSREIALLHRVSRCAFDGRFVVGFSMTTVLLGVFAVVEYNKNTS